MDEADRQAELDNIREEIRVAIAMGDRTEEEVAEEMTAGFLGAIDDLDDDAFRALVASMVREEVVARRAELESDPGSGDVSRLQAAFREVWDRHRIVAGWNQPCCTTCAAQEVMEKAHAIRQSGGIVDGYVFFHEQNTAAAVRGKGLYLSYGRVEPSGSLEPDADIGQRVVDVLHLHGFTADWSGNVRERMSVPMRWDAPFAGAGRSWLRRLWQRIVPGRAAPRTRRHC